MDKFIQVHYGTTQDQIENLDLTKKILLVQDVFETEWLERIIQKNGCPDLLINDHFLSMDLPNLVNLPDMLLIPLWLERFRSEFNDSDFDDYLPETNYCFNFMLNKKMINRHLLLKLVEWFDLESNQYQYTWGGLDKRYDMTKIINELDKLTVGWNTPKFRNALLSPVRISPRWIQDDFREIISGHYRLYNGNKYSWQNIVGDMFRHSLVSLVTETVEYQRGSVMTEKTIYAIMGQTIPIWIGGYGQVEAFRNLGFDTFDDIVNNSYSKKPTLIERCYHAISDNRHLLQDIVQAKEIRMMLSDRLAKNKNLFKNYVFTKYIDNSLSCIDPKFLESLEKILRKRPLEKYEH